MNERRDCSGIQDRIPELATSVIAGDERAEVLRHLPGCPGCRRYLAEMTEVVDELVLLAPQREPPPGFEVAAMNRIDRASGRRPRLGPGWGWNGLRSVLIAASLVLVSSAGGAAVWWAERDDRHLAGEYRQVLETAEGRSLRAARIMQSDGSRSGAIFAYEGKPSWIYATFRRPPAPGEYEVRLRTKAGRVVTLRPLTARAGQTAWGSTLTVPAESIQFIEFVRKGTPVMTARFG